MSIRNRPRRHHLTPDEDPPRGAGIVTLVEPRRGSWYWEAEYRLPGHPPCPGVYAMGATRYHPRPYTVAGLCRTQGTAHAELAAARNAMRAAIVANDADHDHRDARRHTEEYLP